MTEIVHDCADLVVLNKPSGISMLKDRSGAPCLWDQLPDLIAGKPYQVHRLDKGTSGVLVVARNAGTQKRLTALFRERRVGKFYLCWVVGSPPSRGVIDLPLRKGRKSRYRIAGERAAIKLHNQVWSLPEHSQNSAEGLASLTRFRVLRNGEQSLLLASPKTGRTHQLRVHLSWVGYPILGDHLYGRPDDPGQQADRLQLHCHRLVLPGFGSFCAPLSDPGWLDPRPGR